MYYYGMDITYVILMLPALFFGLWAQFKVNSNFDKYSKVKSVRGVTAGDVARYILDRNNLYNVPVRNVAGRLTDHFDPRNNTVNLSDSVYNSTSVAAIGVAAHEVGHAIQHARAYKPMQFRRMILPITSVCNSLWFIIFLLGCLFVSQKLLMAGIILFAGIVIFQVVTLPVEFNASSRAMEALTSYGLLSAEELDGTKKVLNAAAMTYIAALVSSIAHLLRMLIMMNSGRRND